MAPTGRPGADAPMRRQQPTPLGRALRRRLAPLCMIAFLAGCGGGSAIGGPQGTAVAALVEPSPTPSPTPRPTATPTPSPTPVPTATPSPTATATPRPVAPTPTAAPARPTSPPTAPGGGPTPAVATAYTVDWRAWAQGTNSENSYRRTYDAATNEYRVAMLEDDLELSLFAPEERRFGDFVLEVDARRVTGRDDLGYGLVFRRQPRGEGDKSSVRYIFYATPQGYYSLFLVNKDGTTRSLQALGPGPLKVGDAANHLTVTCKGNKITLAANGQTLRELTDTAIATPGEIGIFILSPQGDTTTEVAFKNLIVKPAP